MSSLNSLLIFKCLLYSLKNFLICSNSLSIISVELILWHGRYKMG